MCFHVDRDYSWDRDLKQRARVRVCVSGFVSSAFHCNQKRSQLASFRLISPTS